MSYLSVILACLPAVLRIIEQLVTRGYSQGILDQGKREAIAAATQSLNAAIAKATHAAQEASERHQTIATDDAFDREFQRKD